MTKKLGFKCVLCDKHTLGYGVHKEWGHNPAPLKEKGQCCNTCNEKKVIPARLIEWVK